VKSYTYLCFLHECEGSRWIRSRCVGCENIHTILCSRIYHIFRHPTHTVCASYASARVVVGFGLGVYGVRIYIQYYVDENITFSDTLLTLCVLVMQARG